MVFFGVAWMAIWYLTKSLSISSSKFILVSSKFFLVYVHNNHTYHVLFLDVMQGHRDDIAKVPLMLLRSSPSSTLLCIIVK